MEYKIVTKKESPISNNFESFKGDGERVGLGLAAEEHDAQDTITSVDVTATAYDLKTGDVINISGNELTLRADEAAGSTTLEIVSTTLTYAIEIGNPINMDMNNLFVQYQRKSAGTIAGMPVDADDLGPINYNSAEGVYSIIGVDPTYVKILPRDFVINEDGGYEALEFKDSANSGLQVGDAAQEMLATVNIPYGTTATHVKIWGSNTSKVVEVYKCNVNANGIGSDIGSGTTDGAAISITSTASTQYNYLLILVKVTATSNRIYGGQVTLTQT